MRKSALAGAENSNNLVSRRLLITSICVVLLTLVIVYRYFNLQVLRYEDFATLSEANRVHVRPVPPSRGLIFDRNGLLLADNKPSFSLTIVRERARNLDALLDALGSLIEISDQDLERFRQRLQRRRPYEQTPLKLNLTERERSILAVNSYRLDGAEVSARLMRYYPSTELYSHVIGYVGRISERDLPEIDAVRYAGTDSIGKTGLEKYYEDSLLGEVGSENVETNARGRVLRLLDRTDPKPGTNLTLFIDDRLQRVAYDAMQGERGALVAIDVATGGILAMASVPGFDPNLFVNGIGQKDYHALLYSPDRPLFDRSIRGQYPPGSTVKPMYGLIALQTGSTTPQYSIYDNGTFRLPGVDRPWRDWNYKRGGHGSDVDLHKAIVQSCDVYFYDIGMKTGIDTLSAMSEQFGLGHPTGVDLTGEQPGIMPNRAWKRGSRGEGWYDGDTVNTSIGQGFTLATPLQLAVMVSRIASRGVVRKPHLVKAVDGVDVPLPKAKERIRIEDSYWDYVFAAMQDVVHGARGTAKIINQNLDYHIAGKTGTAQVISVKKGEHYDATAIDKRQWDHALFIAFAPVEDPKIAVGLIIENGQHGSSAAAPVARKLFDAYMAFYADSEQSVEAR